MEKPITIAINEFKTSLIDIVNNSELPAEIMKYILMDVTSQLSIVAAKQLEEDTNKFQKEKGGEQL